MQHSSVAAAVCSTPTIRVLHSPRHVGSVSPRKVTESRYAPLNLTLPSPSPRKGDKKTYTTEDRPSTVNDLMALSKRATGKRDIVESGNAMVAEVTAFLAQRSKQRNADTMRYLDVRMKMKPPPPMTMEELEQHPLAKQKAQKKSKQDRDFDTGVDEEEKEALPFIAKPVLDRDVMRTLQSEIKHMQHELHNSMKSRSIMTPRPPGSRGSTFGNTISGRSHQWEESVDWKSATAQSARSPLKEERTQMLVPKLEVESLAAQPQNEATISSSPSGGAFLTAVDTYNGDTAAKSQNAFAVAVPNTTVVSASPLSVRALGPEHDAQILARDPKELRKIRNEDRHAQFYRGNVVELPLPPKINPEVATTSDMELFQEKIYIHDHEFNVASLKEIERARAAQAIFRPTKVETLQKYLTDDRLQFWTAGQVLGKARRATHNRARLKDNGERLDVFFDHLERLERFTKPSFPEHSLCYLDSCIQLTRSIVTQREGMQEYADFDHVVMQSFPPETLMHYYVADFLRMLAAIFGVGVERFRTWIRDVLKRFEARDYEPVFRSVEVAMGKEVTKEARFRIHVSMVRGSLPAVTRTHMSIRISVERHTSETAFMPGGAKVTWNESFLFHVYDEQSHISIQLIQDGDTIGQGSFSVFRYPVGKPSKMWFPIPGPLIPHAEVNMTVEVLPLLQPPEPKRLLLPAPQQSAVKSQSSGGKDDDNKQQSSRSRHSTSLGNTPPSNKGAVESGDEGTL